MTVTVDEDESINGIKLNVTISIGAKPELREARLDSATVFVNFILCLFFLFSSPRGHSGISIGFGPRGFPKTRFVG